MQCLVWNLRNWACNNGSVCAPLAKLQQEQLANASLLLSYEWSVCQLQWWGQNIPSSNRENCRSSMSWSSLKHLFKRNAIIDQGLEIKLIENTTCVCKHGWLVIPKPLQVHAVKWYHHYLQHPRHTRLEETMNAAMYWKGMPTTIRPLTKSCWSCQINKWRNHKYGHLPHKTTITNPWECLCVDLIGPYTLKGKDNLQINFIALTMINPASSWFEITELPVVTGLHKQTVNGKELLIADKIFDKTLECIAKLVNKTWLCRYLRCCHLIYNNGREFKLYFEYLCKSYGIKRKLTTVKNPQANGLLECVH